MLHAVLTMFVDLKTGCETVWRQLEKEGSLNTSTVVQITNTTWASARAQSESITSSFD